MLDRTMRQIIDPPLNRAGRLVSQTGISANQVTGIGFLFGLITVALIAGGYAELALIPLLLSRLADGLDGAVARATQRTDFGGFLDVAADFFFYGAVPLAMVWSDPAQNGLAGAFLLASFYVNGTCFLCFAILAEKRKMKTFAQGEKSVYFSRGLIEGTETIAFFIVICLVPAWFAPLAWVFGGLCLLTALIRVNDARRLFGRP